MWWSINNNLSHINCNPFMSHFKFHFKIAFFVVSLLPQKSSNTDLDIRKQVHFKGRRGSYRFVDIPLKLPDKSQIWHCFEDLAPANQVWLWQVALRSVRRNSHRGAEELCLVRTRTRMSRSLQIWYLSWYKRWITPLEPKIWSNLL